MVHRPVEFKLKFDHEHKLLLITMGEVVTEASALAATAAVRTFAAAQDLRSGIADLSAVERIEVSTNFIKYLAARPPAIPAEKTIILVAPRDETYGMSRMFQMLRDGLGGWFHVVHSMVEAYELLGIESVNLTSPVSY